MAQSWHSFREEDENETIKKNSETLYNEEIHAGPQTLPSSEQVY